MSGKWGNGLQDWPEWGRSMDGSREWKEYLQEQALLHPALQPQDVAKFCYQAAYGAEHMLSDLESARKYLEAEYEEVQACEGPLWEGIHDRLCRVNLGAWKWHGMPLEWLFRMFAQAVGKVFPADSADDGAPDTPLCGQEAIVGGQRPDARPGSREDAFWEGIKAAESLLAEGGFGFDRESFVSYFDAYRKQYAKPVPVHHSAVYREKEKPSYRLVDRELTRILPILESLCQGGGTGRNGSEMAERGVQVVAIDGRCASGKSTMARQLCAITGAGLVHMDDFFLPKELRTLGRLQEPGGNVHYERFLQEVLPQLGRGEAFSYRRFHCGRMELGESRLVPAGRIRVVEGAYSCHPLFGSYMDLRVFSDVSPKEQLARIARRDGGDALEAFRTRWIPMEERYFKAFGIRDRASLLV